MFLHGFFSLKWLQRYWIKIFVFSNFWQCGLILHQQFLNFFEKIAFSARTRTFWNVYDIYNRLGNIKLKVFVFFNSAPLQWTAFLPKKTTIWDIHWPKMCWMDDKLILFFATTDSWKTGLSPLLNIPSYLYKSKLVRNS